MTDSDEFYVGYLPRAPSSLARRTRAAVLVLALVAAGVAAAIAASQGPFAAGAFEYGVERAFEGELERFPVPTLRVCRPGADGGSSRYLLVAQGKHGFAEALDAPDGARVQLSGSLIHDGERTMIEVVPGSVRALDSTARESACAAAPPVQLGTFTLVGEIVDSKCHLGVMKPGTAQIHRACATLCIRGGIPPLFLVRDPEGRTQRMLLVGAAGEAVNDRVLELVADPVEITGELWRLDDLLVLRSDPASYRRVDP